MTNTIKPPAIGPLPRFLVMSASTTPSSTCWGVYGRVAVLEILDQSARPTCIRDTRGAKVLATWENCNIGTTDRCAYWRAVREAQEFAATRNANG
jgi:hypothetical protein